MCGLCESLTEVQVNQIELNPSITFNDMNFIVIDKRMNEWHRWFKKHINGDKKEEIKYYPGGNSRVNVQDGGSLIINNVKQNDTGTYICEASNSEGSQQLEIHLGVIGPLSVHIQPGIQTVNIGKATELVWSLSFTVVFKTQTNRELYLR